MARFVLVLRFPLALLLVLSFAAPAAAQPEQMTRAQIINLGKPAVGHGYNWSHGYWTSDGSNKTACTTQGDDYNGYGADCSGFVAKVWQVPSPTPVEQDTHPYGTEAFRFSNTHWEQIPRADVKRADAFVHRNETNTAGHIVLVDSQTNNGYLVYEANGCIKGIIHQEKSLDSSYVAIRRNDVIDEPCTPDSCSGHGDCGSDDVCECDIGFGGDHCDRCYEGFVGYPTCREAGACPTVHGTISCNDEFQIRPADGSYEVSSYNCGQDGLDGGEFLFEFRPLGTGTATVSAEASSSSGSVALMLLRNACDPQTACVAADDNNLQFDYGAGEPFYVVVDSTSGTDTDVTLGVTCSSEGSTWIGDPCSSDSDCTVVGSSGHCYEFDAGAFCSADCTSTCPDLAGKAPTFCIADPADSSRGICVSKDDRVNDSCARIPGTVSTQTTRFMDTSKSAQVCSPDPDAEACSASLSGSVVDWQSFEAVPNASITVQGSRQSADLSTDANGAYASGSLPCDTYVITVSADGYLEEQVTVDVTENGVTVPVVELQALGAGDCEGESQISGRVLDGITGEPIAGATIQLAEGVNNANGEIVASAGSDDSGAFLFEGLDAGYYTASVAAPDYSAVATANLSACAGSDDTQDVYMLSDHGGQVRFVLTWQRPADLDIHLQVPSGEEVFFGLCAGSLDAYPYAALDVDHINADGPEAITVANPVPGQYTVFVHNYSGQNDGATETLGNSGAQVVAYGPNNEILSQYSVPSSGSGYFWDVVEFEGSDPLNLQTLGRVRADRTNPVDFGGDCSP